MIAAALAQPIGHQHWLQRRQSPPLPVGVGAVVVAMVALVTLVAPSAAVAVPAQQLPAKVAPLKIGVTLHPYFSWASAVVEGTTAQVVSILPGDVDAGAYQPRPEDIARIKDLDVLLENALGHDAFIDGMVRAAQNKGLQRIALNAETPTLKSLHGDAPNSHTFISITNAIQQTYLIARRLGALRPADAARFDDNAAAYARRLRRLLATAQQGLEAATIHRVATVHDGYSYLLGELGLSLVGVVEPAHGLMPSAAELAAMAKLVRREGIRVVLSEEAFPAKLAAPLQEAGADVVVLSHVATGPYTAEKFEVEMAQNLEALVAATSATSPRAGAGSKTP